MYTFMFYMTQDTASVRLLSPCSDITYQSTQLQVSKHIPSLSFPLLRPVLNIYRVRQCINGASFPIATFLSIPLHPRKTSCSYLWISQSNFLASRNRPRKVHTCNSAFPLEYKHHWEIRGVENSGSADLAPRTPCFVDRVKSFNVWGLGSTSFTFQYSSHRM